MHTPELPFDSVAPVVDRRRLIDIDAVAARLCTSVRHIRRLVQHRLGHADPAMSLGVYGHVPADLDQAAATRLDDLFRPQSLGSVSDSS